MKDQTASTAGAPAAEKPPEPSAKDVANVAGKLVDILQSLPATLQLRALQATATMLGIDKDNRSRSNGTSQQRNQTQQRGGSNR